MSIGSFKTKAAAEVAFAAAVSAQQRSGWVAPEKGRVTLEYYARQWLDTRLTSRGERLRPKTRELYEGSSGSTSSRRWARSASVG